MREILFKAKREDNEEWVYGCYVNSGIHKKQRRKLHFILEDCSGYYDDVIEIVPETVCQYTGLKDKNGKKIFEGDKIRLFNNKNGASLVEFKNEYVGGWVLVSEEWKEHVSLGARKQESIEVIGNIHN